MSVLWQDLKFAARMLKKNVGFTVVAMLTLALGIGANTAIFSVISAVLLQPLPYKDHGQLVSINQYVLQDKATKLFVSLTKYQQILQQNQTFENTAAYYTVGLSLTTEREPEVINGAHASADFFKVLGISPAQGRGFLPDEEVEGGRDVAVVTDGFWHSHFAGDPGLLGKTLAIDGKSVTVVGILPASFRFPLQYPEPEIWLPRASESTLLRPDQIHSGASYLLVIAKLRQGETLARAQALLETINARYREQFGSYVDATKYGLEVTSLEESLVGTLRPSLLALLAAVGFVLLIACANVASLLLARASARGREIGIRKAMGASRSRLVRQLLSESILLSLGGGACGVLLAGALMPALRALSPGAVPRLAEARVDGAVLLFSLLLCILTGIVFGLVPSLQAARGELHESLKEGSRGSSEGGSRGKFRGLLVIAEVCVALVLMTGAGLLIESFSRLAHVNPGFSTQNVMTFPLNLPLARYSQPVQQAEFVSQLLERVRSIPEVQSAGVSSYLPLSGMVRFVFFCAEGQTCQGIGKDPTIAVRQITPGYLETMHTPLRRGRVFNENDVAAGQPVIIINETTAKRFWPNQDPIGKHISNPRDMVPREIVGVVGDVKFGTLNIPNSEEMYQPIRQVPWPVVTLVVRSQANAQPLIAAVRAKVAELDPNLPLSGVASMEQVVATSVAQPRLIMQFAGVFAGFALLLAAIGIYGVMAYSVAARKQEMGIRVALGARPANIFGLVVGQGMRLALAGVALGLAASFALTRLLASLLFNIRATDPLVFTASALVLVGTALVACYLPARRATRVDPIVVLRYE